MSEAVVFAIAAILMGLGALAIIVSSIGVMRFRFVLNRMHAAAVIDTLGLLLIIAGLMVASHSWAYIPKLLLVLLFQWVGSPIASHFVGRLEVRTDEDVAKYVDREGKEVDK